MATGKRYFWIKLKSSFMTSDAVDFLMGQPDGANYVVLYQMLCLKTINTGGKLERHIGEIIIPYDEAKIQRDCKWFSIDTVRVALNLYKALGLIYADQDGVLCLTGHDDLVGSETDYAEKNRRARARQELPAGHNVSQSVSTDVSENVSTEIEIDIESRDRDKSKEIVTADPSGSARQTDVRRVVDEWNRLVDVSPISRVSPDSTRYKLLCARLKEYGVEKVLKAIENVAGSSFLRGQSNSSWVITFDWFVKPNNFIKVLEGNYSDRKEAGANVRADQRTGAASQPEQHSSANSKWGITGEPL